MNRTVSLALALLALLAVLTDARAGTVPWVSVTGRLGTYAMEDVNRDIRSIDAVLYSSFDEINSGFGLGAGVGLFTNPRTTIGVHYERLFAKSEVSDYSGSLTYDLGANAFYGAAEYRAPSPGKASYGAGAAAGIVSLAGEASISIEGYGAASGDMEGTGPLLQGYVFAELPLGPRAALIPLAGYRYAKVSSAELGGQPLYNADGSDFSVDYSGLLVSVSLRLSGGGR